MTVKFFPNEKGNPPGKVADAELHFTEARSRGSSSSGSPSGSARMAGGTSRFRPASTH